MHDEKKIFSKRRESLTGAASAFVYPGLIYMMLLLNRIPDCTEFYNQLSEYGCHDRKRLRKCGAGRLRRTTAHLFRDDIRLKVMGQTFTFTFGWYSVRIRDFGLPLAIFFNQKFAADQSCARAPARVVWVVPMTVTAFIFKFIRFRLTAGCSTVLLP